MPTETELINATMPFVMLPDVENIPLREVEAMGLMPPFHPRYRCDIVVGGRNSEAPAELSQLDAAVRRCMTLSVFYVDAPGRTRT